jgi:hypothetical protein
VASAIVADKTAVTAVKTQVPQRTGMQKQKRRWRTWDGWKGTKAGSIAGGRRSGLVEEGGTTQRDLAWG